ncbi:Agrin [Phytophthora citrophthora]|uniref:Agrin n=1 Tax=Phytophthora citrophthora TaxID=4793 RepID=A0AAD9GIQ3_9STRA|nr:Agrin [Phytophthora citrophthora]
MKFAAGLVIAAIAVSTVRAGNPALQTSLTSDSGSDSASASTDSSAESDCNFVCPRSVLHVIRPPVVDENGVTYESECEMRRAKCKNKGNGKKKEVDESENVRTSCNFACLAVMRPVVDENGVSYSNECEMRRAKCKPSGEKVDILEEYKRLYGKSFGASRDAADAGDESASDKSASNEDDSASESSNTDTSSSDKDSGLDSFCPDICPAVMRPVTDENGVTYSNECKMRAAKCKGKKKNVNVLEEYKRLYGKSFGASRDADDAGDESASEEGDSSSGAVNILQGAPESKDSSEEESASEDGSDKGTPKSYCPNILCPAVFSPVWDENGVQYPNKCSMEAAKCKGPRENVLDEYKRLYGKEFGAPRDESASDEDESASESDDGSKATKMVKGNNKAEKSKCASGCPDVELPVCGSDGVWYSNPCELKIAACENPDADIVEDDGACSSKVTKGEKKAGKISTDIIG